jgi:hypothetical protein
MGGVSALGYLIIISKNHMGQLDRVNVCATPREWCGAHCEMGPVARSSPPLVEGGGFPFRGVGVCIWLIILLENV